MTDIPYVSQLFLYPIKALDGIGVERVTVLKSGALKGDREFAIIDQSEQFVNGKRQDRIHALRAQFTLENSIVSLQIQETKCQAKFHIFQERKALESWLTDYLGFPVWVRQNQEMGFPDDTISPGPTLVSTATLEAIASWYPGLTPAEIRRRFRANIEIAGVPAFWEDQLFGETGQRINFQVGKVQFIGVNPCQRCIVVTRDSQTGVASPNFQKTFIKNRQATLPNWTARSQFNHFFRLAINTRLPISEAGKQICLGDTVRFP
jgi:uncharacterized protein YcbX